MTRLRTEDVANVELELPEGLSPVLADQRRLVQVLVNLLVNAAEVIEPGVKREGGRGRIRLVAATQTSQATDGRPGAPRVTLTVHDSGPGIAPQHLQNLFTPFFTTKPVGKGTGLGLALSRSYMEQMGGKLDAANHPEGGAVFRLELPVFEPHAIGEPKTRVALDARVVVGAKAA